MLGEQATVGGVGSQQAARLFTAHAIYLLCAEFRRLEQAAAPRRGLAEWQVKQVTRYMREHLDEEMGLANLAAMVRLSRSHFCTAFRLATGQTPYDWLVALRIERAQELLSLPDLSITEIALAVGYQTPSSFTASFRRTVGVTPTEYRRTLCEIASIQ
ncbi:helix-turn-helix domain-containing protein [Roseomonas sp. WA12]